MQTLLFIFVAFFRDVECWNSHLFIQFVLEIKTGSLSRLRIPIMIFFLLKTVLYLTKTVFICSGVSQMSNVTYHFVSHVSKIILYIMYCNLQYLAFLLGSHIWDGRKFWQTSIARQRIIGRRKKLATFSHWRLPAVLAWILKWFIRKSIRIKLEGSINFKKAVYKLKNDSK